MTHIIFSFGQWLVNFLNSLPRVLAVALGCVWAYISPTLPFATICVFAVMLDCLSAWRLNRRIKQHVPDSGADGKLKSSHMSKMITDLTMVWLSIILATLLDDILLPHFGGLHLGQSVAAIFVVCTAVSILENESSCNGAKWAQLLQKVLANKVSRHIEMSEDAFNDILRGGKTDEKEEGKGDEKEA